ncbi:MAG: formate dehydrogenase subunit gamma [Betaproteobacteria bacterium]
MPNSLAMEVTMSAARPHASNRHYRRFGPVEIVMHAFMMISFIGLALTGVPLLFADHGWAVVLVKLLGGFEGAALLHRISAVIMTALFVGHIVRVFVRAFLAEDWLAYFWGPYSMVPNLKDGQDIVGMFKWFFGKGPRPQFDRYTYWEKFDYWAVFWGMFIIGGSGFMLWFPTFFAQFLPGWVFNVATIVHGEEALLAVGFIFTIHFFNGHLRPEKFPMDMVIFTGKVSEHELKDERAVEHARLVAQGTLHEWEASAPRPEGVLFGRIIGTVGVVLGLITIGLILFGAIF